MAIAHNTLLRPTSGLAQRDDPLRRQPGDSLAVIKLLLDHGADIEKQGYPDFTALHRACLSNALDVVQPLLDKGAEINARSEDREDGGLTPLDVVELRNYVQKSLYSQGQVKKC